MNEAIRTFEYHCEVVEEAYRRSQEDPEFDFWIWFNDGLGALDLSDDDYFRAKSLLLGYGGPTIYILFWERINKIEYVFHWGNEETRWDISSNPYWQWVRDYIMELEAEEC